MKSLWSTVVLLSALFTSLDGAIAQTNTLSWVASWGSDANNCSRSMPCASVGGAYNKTARGGEIACVDSGPFLGAFLGRSVTINCDGLLATNSRTSAMAFNITLPAGDTIILRGLDMSAPNIGLYFGGAGTLIVDRSVVAGASEGGIYFAPTGGGKLIVTDSIISAVGDGNTGGGIVVKPLSGGTAQVTTERVRISGNTFGIAADGSGSTGGINMTVKDSTLASNLKDGLVATTSAGHAPIGVMVSNTASTNNGYGMRAIGPNATVRLNGSDIAGNTTGLAVEGGGGLLSLGSNAVRANGANGAFSGSEAVQ